MRSAKINHSKGTDDEVEIESPLSNNILDIVDDIGSPKMNFRKSLISQFKHRDSVKKTKVMRHGTSNEAQKLKKLKSGMSQGNHYFNSQWNKSG